MKVRAFRVVITAAVIAATLVAAPTVVQPAGAAPASGGGFWGITPYRTIDTRSPSGGGCVASTRDVTVAGVGGVPADAAAVVLNVTVAGPTSNGFVTVYPTGAQRPIASNVNYPANAVVPNQVTVKVGLGGKVTVFASGGCPQIIIDIQGFFTGDTPGPGGFVGQSPFRLVDSRSVGGCIAANKSREFLVAGVGGVPVNAVGVVLNVTAVPRADGYLTVFPAGSSRPITSNLNFTGLQVVANAVTAKVGASGQISVFNGSAGCNDVVVDVAGYFTAGTPAAAQGGFTGITPYRVRDTRTVGGCLAPNSTLTIQTAGVGDIPGDAAALALNVTTVKPTAAGYITVHPTGVQRPVASNLNFAANRIVPNAVNIGIGNSGSIDLFNGSGGCTHVIVDIVGYFRPTTNPVAPSITGLTPATGRTTGGNTVMISGNGFSNSTAVTFGTIPATSFTIDSPTQITAIAPPAVAGEVTVAVTSLGGSSPTSINSKYTYVLDTLTGASSVVSARDHGCALTSGTVKCWGSNINGQLGNGTTTDSLRPVTVTGITTATAIAAQAWATCALLSNGTVKCWGDNSAGQLGNGTTTAASSPVTVSGITGATAIAAGEEFACAIVAGGAAKCWGYNRFGQLGNGTTSDSLTPVSVSGLSGATAISAGWAHVCALVAGGSAKCWGYGSDGQLGNGTKGGSTQSTVPADVAGLTAATSIDVGTHYSCATLTSGSLKCWGWGPGTGSSLANPGVTTPVAVAGISGATGVTVGNRTVCAIVTSGKVRCLGANWSGELGIGTTVPDSTETPVEVSGLSAATSISAGGASLYFDDGYFTSVCAVVANGAVNCWGYGSFGQLGNGTFDDALLPTDVLAAG